LSETPCYSFWITRLFFSLSWISGTKTTKRGSDPSFFGIVYKDIVAHQLGLPHQFILSIMAKVPVSGLLARADTYATQPPLRAFEPGDKHMFGKLLFSFYINRTIDGRAMIALFHQQSIAPVCAVKAVGGQVTAVHEFPLCKSSERLVHPYAG